MVNETPSLETEVQEENTADIEKPKPKRPTKKDRSSAQRSSWVKALQKRKENCERREKEKLERYLELKKHIDDNNNISQDEPKSEPEPDIVVKKVKPKPKKKIIVVSESESSDTESDIEIIVKKKRQRHSATPIVRSSSPPPQDIQQEYINTQPFNPISWL